MKLSFGFAKKAEPKRVVEALKVKKDDGRQIITSLEEGSVKIDGKEEAKKLPVIPCKNPLEAQRAAVKAKAAAAKSGAKASAPQPGEGTQLNPDGGLSKPKLSKEDEEALAELKKEAANGTTGEEGPVKVAPILMTKGSKRAREQDAPDASKDQFEKVPVESFGEALLRGMGYDPETHGTKPVFYGTPRDNLLGLGAKALLPSEKALIKGSKDAAKKPKAAGAPPVKASGSADK
eukprot:CAMPEP_0195059592 /NCGR_PEP_ID=MMETSP0448-20130528/7047_1 /TAXON_ID=66468 /ORGANISM="Heterocapsa triquestra, Strain CCMP 448" /LENGTH=233 /DNA_ID=CAMNT_0040089893 /DNA_START=72 /DNA_END=773 /DNA_ORIENTATION=-